MLQLDPRPGAVSRSRRLVAVFVLYGLLCLTAIGAYSYHSEGAAELGRRPFVGLCFTQLALLLFLSPLLTIRRVISQKDEHALLQLLPDGAGALRIAISMVSLPMVINACLCLIPGMVALALKALFGGVPAGDIARANLAILVFAVWAFAVGFYCSVRCPDMFSSAGCALLITLVVTTQPVWFGPVISSMSDASLLIQSSLLVNPFVGLASAIDFDLFRTEPLYQICPIGQRRFDYPSWWSVAALFLAASLLLFWRSVAGIRRMAEPVS